MLARWDPWTSLAIEGLETVGALEGLDSLWNVGVSLSNMLNSPENASGSLSAVDSLEGLGGVEGLGGLGVPSASSSICRMGDTGREI